MRFRDRIVTLFGVGHSPVAPGTAGSLVALLLAWPIALWGGRFVLLLAAIAASAIGVWASEFYARDVGRSDPSECVIDELAGQWIVCAFAPVSIVAYLAAFLLFRLLDMTKPWPISRLERLPGGLGIMADDLGAALVAAVIVAALAHAGII